MLSLAVVFSAFMHPNNLLELRLSNGAVLSSLQRVEGALNQALMETASGCEGVEPASGILLVVEDGCTTDTADAVVLESLSNSDRVSYIEREYKIRESLRRASLSIQ